jgi:hypothetical protein
MQNKICLFFIISILINIAGCKKQNNLQSLKNLSNHFNVTLSFNSLLKKDSLAIKSNYSTCTSCKMDWNGERANDIENPMVRVATGYGKSWTFSMDKLSINMPYFYKLTKPIDTVKTDQNKYGERGNSYIGDHIYSFYSRNGVVRAVLVQNDRTKHNAVRYELTDSLVKASMKIKYGSDREYNTVVSMEKIGIENINRYIGVQANGDTVWLPALITAAEIKQDDTNVRGTIYVYKYIRGVLESIYPVVNNEEFLIEDYYTNFSDFIVNGDICYLTVGKIHVGVNNKIFAEFKLDGGMYRFQRLLNDTLPVECINNGTNYAMTEIKNDWPYYIIMASNTVRNIKTGQEYYLQRLYESTLEKNASLMDKINARMVYDMKVENNSLAYLIILENNSYYYVKYDLYTNQLLEKKKMWTARQNRPIPKIDSWDYRYVFFWEGQYIIRALYTANLPLPQEAIKPNFLGK